MDSINSISSPSPSGGDLALKDFQLNTDIKSKLQFSYGKVIAEYINSTTRSNNSYYWLRNNRFRKNRNIANGRIDMRQFMDRLDFNGTVNYANINWACIKIASTTISRIVSQWMGRNEKIQVTAVDIPSVQAKKKQAENVEMVFANKDKLALLQQESGVPMIKQDQFVPEDKDDLDQWVSQFNELPEEIKYEMGVNAIFESNGWTGINKEKQLHDSAEVGLIGTYTYMNENGEIIIEWIKPENMIYSYSEYPDFRDTTWRGHVYTIKISELRAKYGKEFGGILSEEQIFQIACTAKEYQLYDKITWLDNWNISILRPYDEWNVGINSKVAVVGLGGLGHMAIKLAKGLGAHVTLFSRTPGKINDGLELGADEVIISTDEAQMKSVRGKFDLIVDTVPYIHDLNPYVNTLNVSGTLVVVGYLGGLEPLLNTVPMILGRKSVAGSLIGGIAETQEMLDFCGEKNIVSEVEVIKIQDINIAYERMLKSDVHYRFVIDMNSLK